MFCTGKEQLTCNSEKLGCEGCFYFNDENEIKVGDYIRSKDGYIDKVERIVYDELEKKNYYACEKSVMASGFKEDIVKHSSNIIELIEKGDIVHTEDVLNEGYYYMYDESFIRATKENIKNGITLVDILTHEQYKDNCYRVKE